MQEFQAYTYVKKQICFVPYSQNQEFWTFNFAIILKVKIQRRSPIPFYYESDFRFLNKKYHSYCIQYSMHTHVDVKKEVLHQSKKTKKYN